MVLPSGRVEEPRTWDEFIALVLAFDGLQPSIVLETLRWVHRAHGAETELDYYSDRRVYTLSDLAEMRNQRYYKGAWKTTIYPSPYANDPELMEAMLKMEPPPESFMKMESAILSMAEYDQQVNPDTPRFSYYEVFGPVPEEERARSRAARAQREAFDTYWPNDPDLDNEVVERGYN